MGDLPEICAVGVDDIKLDWTCHIVGENYLLSIR